MTRHIGVFGSSGPLGSALASTLGHEAEVIRFGRSEPEGDSNRVRIDFRDEEYLRHAVRVNFAEKPPSGIVFAQRYRPLEEASTLDSVSRGLEVELGPLLTVTELVKDLGNPGPLKSLVLYSSTAAQSAHLDVPIFYHILKSATLSAVTSLSPHLGRHDIKINALVLGDFLKYPIKSYSDEEKLKFEKIADISMGGRCGSISDIVEMTRYLLSEEAGYITGQVINLDGGAGVIALASYIRAFNVWKE